MVSSICFVVALGGKYGAKAGGSVTETRRPGCFEVDKPPPLNMDLIWEASSLPSSKAARSFFPFCRGNRGTPFRNKLIDALLKAMVLHEADFIRSQLSQSFSAIHQQKQRTV